MIIAIVYCSLITYTRLVLNEDENRVDRLNDNSTHEYIRKHCIDEHQLLLYKFITWLFVYRITRLPNCFSLRLGTVKSVPKVFCGPQYAEYSSMKFSGNTKVLKLGRRILFQLPLHFYFALKL